MNPQFELFSNLPYLERWKSVGLKRLAAIIVLFAWLPLVILSFSHKPDHFLMDVPIHIRFLVVFPMLLLTPYSIKDKLWNIIFHFLESGIVKESDRDKFMTYVQSTLKLRDSRTAKLTIWFMVYAGLSYFLNGDLSSLATSWRTTDLNGELSLSAAGLWFAYVSQPIYIFVLVYLIYRVFLWWRLLFLISSMDLQLRASHGDDTGGLIFLGGSIRAFYLPVFALSSSVATGALNLVIHQNFSIEDLRVTVGTLVVFCLFLFVAPLLFFYRPLARVRQQSILSYGALSGYQLEVFEEKWLHHSKETLGLSLVESNEFSAVTDGTSIVNKVYNMRMVPVTKKGSNRIYNLHYFTIYTSLGLKNSTCRNSEKTFYARHVKLYDPKFEINCLSLTYKY